MYQEKDCKRFGKKASATVLEAQNSELGKAAKREYILRVMDTACGEDFEHCKFRICLKYKVRSPEVFNEHQAEIIAEKSNSEQPVGKKELVEKLSEVPQADEGEYTGKLIDQSSDDKVPLSSTDLAVQRDPLAWLERDLTCEQVKEQINARYGFLGDFSLLPPEKKTELERVTYVACKRYEHCRFKSCSK